MVQVPKLTLYYLPVRARCENIRLMLHYANIPYRDRVISFHDLHKWKKKGFTPFGQLPLLKVSYPNLNYTNVNHQRNQQYKQNVREQGDEINNAGFRNRRGYFRRSMSSSSQTDPAWIWSHKPSSGENAVYIPQSGAISRYIARLATSYLQDKYAPTATPTASSSYPHQYSQHRPQYQHHYHNQPQPQPQPQLKPYPHTGYGHSYSPSYPALAPAPAPDAPTADAGPVDEDFGVVGQLGPTASRSSSSSVANTNSSSGSVSYRPGHIGVSRAPTATAAAATATDTPLNMHTTHTTRNTHNISDANTHSTGTYGTYGTHSSGTVGSGFGYTYNASGTYNANANAYPHAYPHHYPYGVDLYPSCPVLSSLADACFESASELSRIHRIVNLYEGIKYDEEYDKFFMHTLPPYLKSFADILSCPPPPPSIPPSSYSSPYPPLPSLSSSFPSSSAATHASAGSTTYPLVSTAAPPGAGAGAGAGAGVSGDNSNNCSNSNNGKSGGGEAGKRASASAGTVSSTDSGSGSGGMFSKVTAVVKGALAGGGTSSSSNNNSNSNNNKNNRSNSNSRSNNNSYSSNNNSSSSNNNNSNRSNSNSSSNNSSGPSSAYTPNTTFTSTHPAHPSSTSTTSSASASAPAPRLFLLGNTVTYADFMLFHILDMCESAQPSMEFLAEYDHLPAYMARVRSLPGVGEYLQQRPPMDQLGKYAL